MRKWTAWLSVWGMCWIGILSPVRGDERRFTYTYESGVPPRGEKEIEPWVTWRAGRVNYFSQLDYRLEYEYGVTDRLLTSIYVNWHAATLEDPVHPGQKIDDHGFDGFSSEWKYKLLDPIADPVGLALYQEYTFQSDELTWESKLILDKRIGSNVIAYNATVEPDWRLDPGSVNYVLNLENSLGVAHFFTPAVTAGFEVFNQNEKLRTSPGLQHSAFFIGPVAGYARDPWWITLTILRQLPALKRSVDNPNDSLVLDDLEKFQVRVIAGVEF